MPNLNPRIPGDLPYPQYSRVTDAPLNVGGVLSITITTGGLGNVVGAPFTIAAPPAGGIQATAEVLTVNASGTVLTAKVTNPGAGYATAPAVSLPGSTGTNVYVAVITTIIPVVEGRVYTTDTTGRLIIPAVTTNVADLTKGILQALATTVTGDGNIDVQVALPPSRIILKAPPGLKKNDRVDIATPTSSTVTQDKVEVNAGAFNKGYLGRIFEIDTKNADGSRKLVTVDDDLVVVDLGVV